LPHLGSWMRTSRIVGCDCFYCYIWSPIANQLCTHLDLCMTPGYLNQCNDFIWQDDYLITGRCGESLRSITSRRAEKTTQPPILCIPRNLSLRVRRSEHEAYRSLSVELYQNSRRLHFMVLNWVQTQLHCAFYLIIKVHQTNDIWKKTKLRDLSPQANYTDRVTAACRRS
jgi:hypothetical protein